eukprot:TRINITY_DN14633_c0_g1_i1.p1 TRINITY_DN14633_c0_g1~~TRINITY_DN14633_c0_g1_i1.p1  ORF type:complete len:359 (-),score=56.24 TRINITY_DN14633_c0_g1_i1:238-1314(-)
MSLVRLKGSQQFRYRIIASILSSRPIKIAEIRDDEEEPGLKDFEACFLRMVEKISNGCAIEINETGTQLLFRPGILVGGRIGEHDCGLTRGIGYYMEALLCLAPFCKKPIEVTLLGITNSTNDLSVDTIRTCSIKLLKNFGVEDGIEFKIKKRGAPPSGGGEVYFKCPIVVSLKPIMLINEGKIRRIRGLAYSTRIAPNTTSRIVDSSKTILNQCVPDVFIYTDHYKGAESGKSPGYGLSLLADTTTGCMLSVDAAGESGETPEDLGSFVSRLMVQEIAKGGCVDTAHQCMMLLYMVLCPEDVSKIRFGKLTEYSVEFLRLLREFFGVTFKVVTDPETKTVLLTCMGIGFKNLSKKVA